MVLGLSFKRFVYVSLLIHMLFGAFVIAPYLIDFFSIPIPTPRKPMQVTVRSNIQGSVMTDLRAHMETLKDKKPEELEAMLKQLVQQAKIIPEKSIDQMVDYFGIKRGSYLEAKPKQNARFNMDTASLGGITKKPYPKGQYGYTIILIDHQGVRLNLDITPAEVTPDYDRFYRVYQLMQANPSTAAIYNKLFVPLFAKLMGGMSQAQPVQRKQPKARQLPKR